jgi:transcriptional regulator with XRE-family HTH domain
MAETFAERLKRLRLEKGYKQGELSRLLGIHEMSVSRWERGIVQSPDSETLIKLATALGTTSRWLLTGIEADDDDVEFTDPDPPFWNEFLARYSFVESLGPEKIQEIRRFALRALTVKSWTDLERIAEIVRTSQPSKLK